MHYSFMTSKDSATAGASMCGPNLAFTALLKGAPVFVEV